MYVDMELDKVSAANQEKGRALMTGEETIDFL